MTTIPSPPPVAATLDDARASLGATTLTGWTAMAGMSSLGAGAIHAAAIGVHAEHRPAATTFVIVAAIQLAWGALALVRSNRLIALLGAGIGLGAFAGWVWAKVWGIGFIPGLDEAEPVQTADGIAAAMALASVLLIAFAAWAKGTTTIRVPRPPLVVTAIAVLALSLFGMAAGGTHVHAEGHDEAAGGGHGDSHGDAAAAGDDHGDHTDTADHEEQVVVPFDPEQPIDFSGIEGVTPRQQAWAENVVGATLLLLPQWADPEYALANGFHSIGDGFTGTEHFINDENIDDPSIFDPAKPESLVWDTTSGERRLVAAMYMLERGTPLEDAPNLGGNLMQWHIHNNLCYTPSGQVVGITNGDGECPPGLILPEPTPMVHVWLEPQACGPFSALEGIGGGQINEGEEVLCNEAHGGH
jgi:hypothetical protein